MKHEGHGRKEERKANGEIKKEGQKMGNKGRKEGRQKKSKTRGKAGRNDNGGWKEGRTRARKDGRMNEKVKKVRGVSSKIQG